ncbi:MAG TPA: hypothetical protein VHV50_05215 [Actinomycetota bacterium]|jgi:hypothetical protein|nr:hypothetical protein [Actinomycetota bacterium]
MAFGDSVRRFFSKRAAPDLSALESFAAARRGVEAFIEPRTATSPTTLLLVDRDGDHVRAPVRDPRDAAAFCKSRSIPLYDAQVIGYPRRMKDFEKRSKEGALEVTSFESEIDDLERRLAEPGKDTPNE